MTFNSFPQPRPDSGGGGQWVHDWSAYQTVYDFTGTTVSVTAGTFQTYVNITGKGFLKWARAFTSTNAAPFNPAIRITIDGVAYTFQQQSSGNIYQGNEINQEIPFKQSLKIEVQNAAASAVSLGCDYLYLLQQSTPNLNNSTLLLQSQRNMGYLSTAATTLTDVINVTGSGYLLGLRYNGYFTSGAGSIVGDITVDGTIKMNSRTVFYTGDSNNRQTEWGGPVRFNSSLRIRTNTTAAGSTAVCFAYYSLD